ncbi:MAG: hypothetical protein V7750_16575 [Sneathiella sp.]
MTGFPRSPRLAQAGLVIIDPETGSIEQVITLQYASETLKRTLQVQSLADEPDRSHPLRLTGPAVETITLEAELDATDQLEFPDENAAANEAGIFPQLSAMEMLVHPTSSQLTRYGELAAAGTMEILPIETPLALFVWSANRIVPIRISDLSISEEFFDTALNPIRAKVNLSLRVLSVNDLGFKHRGGGLFMAYLKAKENLAARAKSREYNLLGIGGLP